MEIIAEITQDSLHSQRETLNSSTALFQLDTYRHTDTADPRTNQLLQKSNRKRKSRDNALGKLFF